MARILVVDDTPMMVQLVSLTLGKAGHEVRGARTAARESRWPRNGCPIW